MDRHSTIMLCRMVTEIGFRVMRVFSASATRSGPFSVFQESRFHRAHAIAPHAGRHGTYAALPSAISPLEEID
jgi:hypothetical protein